MYNASACQPNKEHPIKGKRIIAQVFIIDDVQKALMPAHIIRKHSYRALWIRGIAFLSRCLFPLFPGTHDGKNPYLPSSIPSYSLISSLRSRIE